MPTRRPVHKPVTLKTREPEQRLSAARRGYNRTWAKARLSYLSGHPLCVGCEKAGILRAAAVVDHVIPHRGDRDLFWDRDNWQSLCKQCHDQKTWRETVGVKA